MRRGMFLSMFLVSMWAVPGWAGMDEGTAAYDRGDFASALREAKEGTRGLKVAWGRCITTERDSVRIFLKH
jgi:hypothetical protein